jgi:tetraacyldisaccharide 4'-kinase
MRAPDFWLRNGVLSTLLQPAGWLYGATVHIRRRLTRPTMVGEPVVCVGNLVAGGAGKTPVALAVRARASELGIEAHFLSRGHGGREAGPLRVDPARHDAARVGDEPCLLARVGPTWIARDRVAGAQAAIAAGAAMIIMDDGHQNPTLAKDLSLVVIDGEYGFGNGHCLPAGPLREPVARGLAEADALVILGNQSADLALPTSLPVLSADLAPGPEAAALAGQRVLAFAGIGRPEKFFRTLAAIGCEVVDSIAFADHHAYDDRDIDRLLRRAGAANAAPITTEKDAVRLPEQRRAEIRTLSIEVRWRDPALIDGMLRNLVETENA